MIPSGNNMIFSRISGYIHDSLVWADKKLITEEATETMVFVARRIARMAICLLMMAAKPAHLVCFAIDTTVYVPINLYYAWDKEDSLLETIFKVGGVFLDWIASWVLIPVYGTGAVFGELLTIIILSLEPQDDANLKELVRPNPNTYMLNVQDFADARDAFIENLSLCNNYKEEST